VWYGHAVTKEDYKANGGPTGNWSGTGLQDSAGQLNDFADGGNNNNQPSNLPILARHIFALLPADRPSDNTRLTGDGGVGSVPAHPDIFRTGQAINVTPTGLATSELPAAPPSGRTSAAALTPGQLMARVRYAKYSPIMIPAVDMGGTNRSPNVYPTSCFSPLDGGFPEPLANPVSGFTANPPYDGSDLWFEARYLCYRFQTIRSAMDGTNAAGVRDTLNGVYRLSDTLLKNCDSFIVEWTDGTVDSTGNLRWYGGPNVFKQFGVANWGTPPVLFQEWLVANFDRKAPQWPPVDYSYTSWWTGGTNGTLRSMISPLSDKHGEYRKVMSPTSPAAYVGRSDAVTFDVYTAVFSQDNKKVWPKALRVTLSLNMINADSPNQTNIISKPQRTYSQVMWLPQ
jgi:hypothetical protein